MNNVTASYSLDKETKETIDRLARETKRSRSDVVRDMAASYSLRSDWQAIQQTAGQKAKELGITSEEDVEKLLK